VTGSAIFLAASLWVQQQQPLVHSIAQGMAGERWYRVALYTEHVGFMYNHVYQDHLGQWHFVSTTHFLLNNGTPNTLSKALTFAAQPPYPLVAATYTNQGQQQSLTTTVTLTPEQGYLAEVTRPGQSSGTQPPVILDWSYDLSTFLNFEHWLATAAPGPDEEKLIYSPDFERLRINRHTYRIVEQNKEGYLVETNAPLSASQTQLDQRFRPLRLHMAGVFNVVTANEADAISLTKLSRKTNYLFNVDQRLRNHTALETLDLRLDGTDHPALPKVFKLRSGPISSTGLSADIYSGEELRFPITHPKIQTLVQPSIRGDAATTIELLLDTANRQLSYAENRPAGTVLTALSEGAGECTDYADLFTTLARAAGYPARNVYGLAYKDGPQPAFMFHAWNEVYYDGQWHAVDPTWNQTRVDASHIPLSDTQAALLMLANNTQAVSFSVLAAEYF